MKRKFNQRLALVLAILLGFTSGLGGGTFNLLNLNPAAAIASPAVQAQEDIDTDVEEPDDAVEEADEPSADDATVGEESEEEPAEASEDLDNAEEEDSDEELNFEESSEETDEEVEAAQNDDGLVDVPENENLEDIEELEIEEEAAKSEEIVEGEEALAEEVSLEEEDTSDALEAVLPNEGTNMPNFAVTIKKGGNSWSGNEVAGDTVPFTVNVKPGSTTKATMDTLTSAKVYLNLSWIPSDEKDTEVSFVYGTDKKVFESGEDIELDTIAWDDSNGNNLNVSAKFGDIAGEGEIQAYVKVGATVASIKGTTTVAKSGSIEIVCPAGTPSVTTDSSGSGAASVVSGGTHKFTAQVTPETFIDTSIAVGKVWTRWTWVDPNEDGYPFGTYSGPIYQAAAYDDDNRYYEATYEPTASGDIGTYSGYFKVEAVLSSSTGTYSETYNIGNWSTSVKACSSVEIVSGFTPGSITTTQAVDYGGTASINVKVTPASALGTGVKGIKAIFTVYNDQMEDRVANKNRVALVDGTGTSATEVGTIKKTCT